jgi:hypothetical protein
VSIADELGGDGGEEGEVLGGVKGGDPLIVLGLEGVVPALEILLRIIDIKRSPRELRSRSDPNKKQGRTAE